MNRMVSILVGLLLIGGGCATAQPSNPITNTDSTQDAEASLKIALEKTYTEMHAALEAKDFNKFTASFSKKDARLTEKLFLESLTFLNKALKPLDQSKFIEAYQKGDKAYMIRQTYLDDPNFISLDGQIYEYKNGAWLIGEYSYGDSISKDKTNPTNDAAAIEQSIAKIKKELEGFVPETQP